MNFVFENQREDEIEHKSEKGKTSPAVSDDQPGTDIPEEHEECRHEDVTC